MSVKEMVFPFPQEVEVKILFYKKNKILRGDYFQYISRLNFMKIVLLCNGRMFCLERSFTPISLGHNKVPAEAFAELILKQYPYLKAEL